MTEVLETANGFLVPPDLENDLENDHAA